MINKQEDIEKEDVNLYTDLYNSKENMPHIPEFKTNNRLIESQNQELRMLVSI